MKFKRKIFALLMAMTMMVAYMPSFAFAEDAPAGDPAPAAHTQVDGQESGGDASPASNTENGEKPGDTTEPSEPAKAPAKGGPLRAGGSYTVSYEYSTSDLPSAVTDTLPTDDNTYEDGTTVTPKDPSSEDVLVGSDRYTFDGWDANSKTINGADIKFTGTWSVADAVDTGGDDSDEYEDESSYDPNPPQPESYADDGLLTIQSLNQIGGSGTHLVAFDKGYGTGVCCYHTRKHAGVGSKGYIRELTATDAHYEEIKRAMYWGFEKGDGNSDLGHAFSIHIMLSYWMNGNKSLSSGFKSGTSRFASAKKYCKKLYDKGAAPDNFHIYEWVGVGGAASKQILITYKIVNGGYVTLVKSAADTATNYITEAPNNYSLEGAVYELFTDVNCTERAFDTNYNYVSFTTKADGTTDPVEVEEGVYYAKETTASKGFKIDTSVDSVSVTTENTIDNPAVINSTEPPAFSNVAIEVEKTSRTDGWRRLIGAKYKLSYYDLAPGTDPTGETPKRSWIVEVTEKKVNQALSKAALSFATDDLVDGSDDPYLVGSDRVLPVGVFSIEEYEAPEGLARDETLYGGKVAQPSNGAQAEMSFYDTDKLVINYNTKYEITHLEDPQSVIIKVQKKDAETGEETAQGTDRENVKGSLAGAVYNIYYDTERAGQAKLVGTITTDEEGKASLEKQEAGSMEGELLEPGYYFIEEVQASPGYTLDKFYYEEKEGEYEEGKHIIRARVTEGQTATFEYTVESKEQPHHTYVSKTDIATGEELPGATLQVLDSQGNIVEQWVSTDKPHDIVALHDETQGLKDGKYTLREITAPYGYDIAEDVEFEVKANQITNTVEMKNAPIEIKTTATDVETETHQGTFSKEEKIKDTVKYENLYAGRTYTFEFTVHDKKTGEALKRADGSLVKAEKEFTPEGESGTLVSGEVVLEATVDASEFTTQTSVVAFEKLYREDRELAAHADLKDDDQTIHYGGIIGTTALDSHSGTHNVLGSLATKIIDRVKFENLSTKETYTLEGEFYDLTTGQMTGIKASKQFTPSEPDGTVDVEFSFDGTPYEGHTLVCYEKLYLNGTEINKHEDPKDPAQTMYVPKIRTVAGKPTKKGKVIDTIQYENLIPGMTYVARGNFVYQKDGKPVPKSDGYIRFTPATPNGTIDVTLSCAKGKGKMVAFERVYIIDDKGEEKIVGHHVDSNDKAQTIEYKPVGKIVVSDKDKFKSSGVKTGDNTLIALWIALMTAAASGIVVLGAKRRRDKIKEENDILA